MKGYIVMESIFIKSLPGEIWRPIKNYPLYCVSNMGRVKSIVYERGLSGKTRFRKEHLLRPSTTKDGYKRVTLTKNIYFKKTFSVHRLVAIAFIPNPLNLPEVNHLSEDKGDNRVCNLVWSSKKENANYGTRNERISKNKKGRKLTDEQMKKYLARCAKPVECEGKRYEAIKYCAATYGVKRTTMQHWLDGSKKMPSDWRDKGLKFI